MNTSNKKIIAVQDNSLIDASYKITLNEKRLLLLAVSKLESAVFLDADERKNKPLTITAECWSNMYSDDSNAYRALSSAAKNFMKKTVKINVRHGHIKEFAWLQEIDYFKNEGYIEIKFSDAAMTRLIGLYQDFTKLNLLDVAQFTSAYSVRIYELIQQFAGTGVRQISIEDFRFALDCTDIYQQMSELKRRVLMPALDEINNKSPLVVECKDIKKGRQIVAFKFTFKKEF